MSMSFVEYVICTPFSYYVIDGIYACLCSRKYIMYTLKFNLFALIVYADGNIYIEFVHFVPLIETWFRIS